MSIIEKISNIGNFISELYDFINNNEEISEDWLEYKKTLNLTSEASIKASSITYIFDRLIGGKDNIFSIYAKTQGKLSRVKKKLLMSFEESIDSIFEVKKVGKNGFELYNLVNEKTYFAISMVKMTHFRQIGSGNFVIARIIEYESEFYLIELRDAVNASEKEQVYKYAVAKILENPKLLYKDNKEKQKCIEKIILNMYTKFLKCFKTDEIITTNVCADKIIEIFNNYETLNILPDFNIIESYIKMPEKFAYFKSNDFNFDYNNFLEKSLIGFSSNTNLYDVGIIFNKQLGFYAIPFYGTLCNIFQIDDYQSIDNYKDCLISFLNNNKIPDKIFEKLNEKYENFIFRVNEILNSNYTFDSLMLEFKSQYLSEKVYSPTSVLYASETFNSVLSFINPDLNKNRNKPLNTTVGRNDPCPCGSGKKYKKCCLTSVNVK